MMTDKEYRHALDFAEGRYGIFYNPEKDDEPLFLIDKDCPKELAEKIKKTWGIVKEETIKRHKNMIYKSYDYFW